jgi:hypothetical protein
MTKTFKRLEYRYILVQGEVAELLSLHALHRD